MTDLQYQILQHDGGWAYQVDGSFSETFASHALAHRAATAAAAGQQAPGETIAINFQDAAGRNHEETGRSDDRPRTRVTDKM